MKTTRSVVVVYEDTDARKKAVDFCDNLVKRFWTRYEFALKWWSFTELDQPTCSKSAASKAAEADVIIFSCAPKTELPSHVGAWIENWINQRGDREGSLASLTEPDYASAPKHVYLRAVAHRAGMDYLTEVPQDLAQGFPDSLDYYSERASQVTDVLEEILNQNPAPPRI